MLHVARVCQRAGAGWSSPGEESRTRAHRRAQTIKYFLWILEYYLWICTQTTILLLYSYNSHIAQNVTIIWDTKMLQISKIHEIEQGVPLINGIYITVIEPN